MASLVHHIPIGLTHRMGDQLIADTATIDVEVLKIPLTARERWQAHPAPESQPGGLQIKIERIFHKRRAANSGHPSFLFCLTGGGAEMMHGLAVIVQGKINLEMTQGQLAEDFVDTLVLGGLGSQKLAPGRCIKEQIAHLNCGAQWMGDRGQIHGHITTFGLGFPARAAILVIGGNCQP